MKSILKQFDEKLDSVIRFNNPDGRGYHDGSREIAESELKSFLKEKLEEQAKEYEDKFKKALPKKLPENSLNDWNLLEAESFNYCRKQMKDNWNK